MKALLIFVFASVVCTSCFGQYTNIYAPQKFTKAGFDSMFLPGADTLKPKDITRNWITIKDKILYGWDNLDYIWRPLTRKAYNFDGNDFIEDGNGNISLQPKTGETPIFYVDTSFLSDQDFTGTGEVTLPIRTIPFTVQTTDSSIAYYNHNEKTLYIPPFTVSDSNFYTFDENDFLVTDGYVSLQPKTDPPVIIAQGDTTYLDDRDFVNDGSVTNPVRTIPFTVQIGDNIGYNHNTKVLTVPPGTDSAAIVNIVNNYITGDTSFISEITNVFNNIAGDTTFINSVVNNLLSDTTFINNVQNIVNNYAGDSTFIQNIANNISSDTTLINNLAQNIFSDTTLINYLVQSISNDTTLINNVTNNLTSDTSFFNSFITNILNDTSFTNIIGRDFTLTTDSTADGLATFDTVSRVLNIPPIPLTISSNLTDSIDYSFVSLTPIYNEYGPGDYIVDGSGLSVNPENRNFPFKNLKAIDVGAWTANDFVSFTNNAVSSTTAYTFFRAFIRLKSAVDIPSSISVTFLNGGQVISKTISIVNYGLDKSKVGRYQNISIPMSAFAFTNTVFDEVRIRFGGANSSGLYIDLVQFQNAEKDENAFITAVEKSNDSLLYVKAGQRVFFGKDSVGLAVDTQFLRRDVNLNTASLLSKEPLISAGLTSEYRRGDKTWQTLNTDAVLESSNLYFRNDRSRKSISVTGNGGSYDSATGVISLTGGGSSGWSKTGDTINPATNFIGTKSNNSFRIRTNNIERARIDSVGNTTIAGGNTTINGDLITLNGNQGNAGVVQIQKFGQTLVYVNTDQFGVRLGNGIAQQVTLATTTGTAVSTVGNITLNASAAMEIRSTRGFLPPRLTTAQRDILQKGVNEVIITSGGSGYTTVPTVTFSAGPSGSASGNAVISGGSVVSVTITTTAVYNTAPTVAFSGGGGSGAAATAVVVLPEGIEIYNLTVHQKQYWNGSTWISY